MKYIEKILTEIEGHIKANTYKALETNNIEFKDLSSSGSWDQLYISVCSFLNTQGGIVIIGIQEDIKKKQFKFTGYNPNDENKIKEISAKINSIDGSPVDLIDYIQLNAVDIIPFLTGHVCVLYIEKLPLDRKYVFFKEFAYERQLTGDHRISTEKINRQLEIIEELRNATELETVENVTLEDLDIDLLNEYIIKLNADKKVETIKADIQSAISFLIRKKFVRENKPTLLGLLVCGKHIGDLVGGKCELDAYFETGQTLADDKKIYKENIIPLMESGWAFTFSKTSIGVSVHRGGTAVFEYPEAVIRETINNALAHRDYSSDRFSVLRIVNDKCIEIKNPGRFKQNQLLVQEKPLLLRRIIPTPKAQNPNLADVLKVYNRWEGRGIGMATLVNYALNNQIDVPYYRIYNKDELGLFIQKGQVLDIKTASLFASFDKYIAQKNNNQPLSNEELTVLAYFYKSEKLNEQERFTINLTPDNNHFDAIQQLLKSNLITKLAISTLEYQVYQVDKIFYKTDFSNELNLIFGNDYYSLSAEYKEILQVVYQLDMFSNLTVLNANVVGNSIYFRENSSYNIDTKKFDSFKRSTRGRINNLEKQGFLQRKVPGKSNYQINSAKKKSNLFES